MQATPRPLNRAFFLDSPGQVARALLGKLVLCRDRDTSELLSGRIVETEAYFGSDDEAAHAFAGKTARCEVLFGPPGHAYVYFVYGMHYCLNVSCGPEGKAGCVLIRALEPVSGLSRMAELRGLTAPRLLASGPGRLCHALGITRPAHNGLDVCAAESALVFAEDGYVTAGVTAGPRIGIRKAVDLVARYWVEGNAHVSGPRKA